MADMRFHVADRSLPVRWLFVLVRLLASLTLAVVLIGFSALVLAWATWLESEYKTPAVQQGVYGTPWFAALVVLLGVNVLAAALVRYPWKRHQTGFLITHAGILVLLLGCLLSRLGGIDAHLSVFEQEATSLAYQSDKQYFELRIAGQEQSNRVLFVSGPFNWADYRQRLSWFPWGLVHRDQGVLYDQDGIRLEVLDYLDDSVRRPAEPLVLSVQGLSKPVELAVREMGSAPMAHHGMGVGGRQELPHGEQIVFWIARNRAETEAFLHSGPEGTLGPAGQLVLHAAGTRFSFAPDQLKPRVPVPLGDSGLSMQLVQYDPSMRAVVLRVDAPQGMPERMILLADFPEFNKQATGRGVWGTYWMPADARAGEKPETELPSSLPRAIGRPRIDLIQGADGKLYRRVWRGVELESLGPVPTDESLLTAFEKSKDPVRWSVQRFVPADGPGWSVAAVPFTASHGMAKCARARVRLTVDQVGEEFWLRRLDWAALENRMYEESPEDDFERSVGSPSRRLTVSLSSQVIELGFQVRLRKFDRRLDPGSNMASHYSSQVDLLSRDGKQVLREDVAIPLNEPVDFSDPESGRSYRLFQESFNGPWRPGDPVFERHVRPPSDRPLLYMSTLAVNHDPGRALKYFGSFLVVAGVAVMFYMKAYFFRRRGASQGSTDNTRELD